MMNYSSWHPFMKLFFWSVLIGGILAGIGMTVLLIKISEVVLK